MSDMQEILLIRGGSAAGVIDLLAVAAELSSVYDSDTQIDLAVPAEYAGYAALSMPIRRVIPIASPDTGDWSHLAASDGAGAGANAGGGSGGLGSKLFSAAKKLSSVAGKNVRAYWELANEIRMVNYSVVFDFDSSPFSIAVGKLAKTGRIVGFDPETLEHPAPGAAMVLHDIYAIKGDVSPSTRLRQLVARAMDHRTASEGEHFDWKLRPCDKPASAPSESYIAIDSGVPSPFLTLLEGDGRPLVKIDGMSETDVTGLVRAASLVVGGGVAPALAAATGTRALFIGNKQNKPLGAQMVGTPAELTTALAGGGEMPESVPAPSAPSAPSASAPAPAAVEDGDSGLDPISDTPSTTPKTIKLK